MCSYWPRRAVGRTPTPPTRPTERVAGFVLTGACRFYEFAVRSMDESQERVQIRAEVVHRGTLREFFGLNRAKHAVVEAAILATRVHLTGPAEVLAEYRKFRVLVEKTGGPAEHAAFAFLTAHVERAAGGPG